MKYQPLLVNQDWMFTLETDDKGALFLDVVCGGIGMYCVRVQLTGEEADAYHSQGMPFLEKLAKLISRDVEAFRSRVVH